MTSPERLHRSGGIAALEAGVTGTGLGQRVHFTTPIRLDRDLGVSGDPSTAELFAFVDATLEETKSR